MIIFMSLLSSRPRDWLRGPVKTAVK